MGPRRLDKRLERARNRYLNQTPEHQARWEGHNLGNQDPTRRGRGRHRKPPKYTFHDYAVIGLVTCLVIIAATIVIVATLTLSTGH